MKKWLALCLVFLLSQLVFAGHKGLRSAPQPTPCLQSEMTSVGDQWWRTVTLKIVNRCGRSVDFQNASITFENEAALDTGFWGDFAPLPYPDNALRITSQPLGTNRYLSSLHLHFPTYPGANSQLPDGRAINIKYGASSERHVPGTIKVYVDSPVSTGSIAFTNVSTKPADVSDNNALVKVLQNGQFVTNVQVPWNSSKTLTDLAQGSYTLQADRITGTTGQVYEGTLTPATINVVTGQTANVSLRYTQVQQGGKLSIRLQQLPSALSGYTGKPTISVREASTGSAQNAVATWGQDTLVSNLKNGSSYQFETPSIQHNGYQCQPTFDPQSVTASATTTPITSLRYTCTQIAESLVTIVVSGAPSSLTSLKVTFTPTTGAAISKTVPISDGNGSTNQMLMTGMVYNVSSEAVPNYQITFSPQPLTAEAGAFETINLTPVSTGDTPVARHGQLKVCGTKLCDFHGDSVQLKGMSSHGIQWYGWGNCLTTQSLDALAQSFKANVFRASMYIQEGGYETNPTAFTNQMNLLIDEATKRGIYIVIDWHMLTPGDPNYNLERAKKFFTDIATRNKGKNNLIYEIANEPNGVSWASIKSYAESLIPVIRAIDPVTPIIVGTPGWSSLGISDGKNAQEIINNPVNATNIMYAFHFYAASHRDLYLNELDRASNILPIFVSEFGTQTYSGDGANDFAMADRYMALMARKEISWTNWNFSDDFRSGAIWKDGTCPQGPWTDASLKPAGIYIKGKIMENA